MRANYRHLNLLATLLLVIGVSPFFPRGIAWLMEGLLLLTLAAGALAASPRRRLAIGLGALAVLSIGARAGYMLGGEHDALLYIFLAGYICFFSIVIGSILRSLFRVQGSTDVDTICGAISVYLAVGLVWAMAYAILENALPGSFDFSSVQEQREQFERFLGFSFATLTTVGYGNISPATPRADALTSVQAIVGQFYIAIVIARFVALHLMQHSSGAND